MSQNKEGRENNVRIETQMNQFCVEILIWDSIETLDQTLRVTKLLGPTVPEMENNFGSLYEVKGQNRIMVLIAHIKVFIIEPLARTFFSVCEELIQKPKFTTTYRCSNF